MIKLTLLVSAICQILSLSNTTNNSSTNGTSPISQGMTSSNGSNVIQYCLETDTVSACIKSKRCCHVTNSYSSFTYSACVDVQSTAKGDHIDFCNKFYGSNADNNYRATECVCNDYITSNGSILKASYMLLLSVFILYII